MGSVKNRYAGAPDNYQAKAAGQAAQPAPPTGRARWTRPSPDAAPNGELHGRFGMCEIEMAARRIVDRCQFAGNWAQTFGPAGFLSAPHKRDPNELALSGFCHLIERRWLVLGEAKGADWDLHGWVVTDAFIKRVVYGPPKAGRRERTR